MAAGRIDDDASKKPSAPSIRHSDGDADRAISLEDNQVDHSPGENGHSALDCASEKDSIELSAIGVVRVGQRRIPQWKLGHPNCSCSANWCLRRGPTEAATPTEAGIPELVQKSQAFKYEVTRRTEHLTHVRSGMAISIEQEHVAAIERQEACDRRARRPSANDDCVCERLASRRVPSLAAAHRCRASARQIIAKVLGTGRDLPNSAQGVAPGTTPARKTGTPAPSLAVAYISNAGKACSDPVQLTLRAAGNMVIVTS
jgi:hypothetical protein